MSKGLRLIPILLVLPVALAIGIVPRLSGGALKDTGQSHLAAIDGAVRERPTDEYTKDWSHDMVEAAATFPVGQYRIVGTGFLVRVIKVERLAGHPGRGGTVQAADNHEYLRVEAEFEHMFGCSGVTESTGKGVGVALAYRDGYDAAPDGVAEVEGACGVDATKRYPVGWRSKGICEFYYNKAWAPRYLVLSEVDLERGVNRPAAKVTLAD